MVATTTPTERMPLPYMNPNIAEQARVWMAAILTTGVVHLLPTNTRVSGVTTPQRHPLQALPSQILHRPPQQSPVHSYGISPPRVKEVTITKGLQSPRPINR
jgi:hypothetical protein